jgi:integrase/recombinase XerD
MKEELITRILAKASGVISIEQARELRDIMRMELTSFDLNLACTAIVTKSNVYEKIAIFLETKDLNGIAKSTLKNYKRILISFACTLQKNIEDATEEDINKFLYIKKQTVKASTLNTIISSLKSFISWLAAKKYISNNIMFDVKPMKTPKRVRKYLSKKELEMIRYSGRNLRDDAMIEVFYSTGCRLSEIHDMNISDINFTNGGTMVIGKGNKEREVYLSPKALLFIEKYRETITDKNDALFVSERNPHTRLGRRAIQRVFNILGNLAGLNRNLHPHLMRHTFASHLLQNGADIYIVKGLMGHEEISTTEIYAVGTKDAARIAHGKAC